MHKLYRIYIKRFLDFVLSLTALTTLFPLMLILTFITAIMMRGNPFFVYPRAGKEGKIFNLIKYRTMANLKDANNEFLPDEMRITGYGRFLRSTSLDELPELINILLGHMSIVGPRPLTYKYLDYYTEEENKRHDVRPGLTGLAQINGRNALSWEKRFEYDVQYVKNLSFLMDVKIILKTFKKVFERSNVDDVNLESLHKIRSKSNIKPTIRGNE